ncbi:ABC transporter permease [Nocardioides nanhaiensis]|uniref:ABC transporter permease n=1 Tax=Nocardioides nanhaiensis TaxID=1476871 RepID=A0ABP8WLP3_9ACTN
MTELPGPKPAAESAVESQTIDPSGEEPREQSVRSLRGDAWRDLRKNPLFWIASVMILVFVAMAIAPGLFTNTDPRDFDLGEARSTPTGENWFGRDTQGYDLYARCIYGARASILVGLFSTIGTMIVGVTLGLLAGYKRGWVDGLTSRVAEVFFGLPLILGAIIILTSLQGEDDTYLWIIFQVVLAQVVLGWPSIFRLMRASVLQVTPNDYVASARALGASPLRVVRSHVLPNAIGPVIVISTINFGGFIAAEAALSFLGIGLRPPTISWGVMIDAGLAARSSAPHVLLFPALFLSLAVLAFIMLGDAIRDAFDPKSR